MGDEQSAPHETSSPNRRTPKPSDCTAPSATATAPRSPTRCSRSGRQTPRAGSLDTPVPAPHGFTFTGWGRAATDNTGHYSFSTVEPGTVDDDSAPFFAMTVFARGLLNRLFTRIYLPDYEALAADPSLATVPADRRDTLVARREGGGLVFDVTLQGAQETVFLAYLSQGRAGEPHSPS
jgi:hypothetical protein